MTNYREKEDSLYAGEPLELYRVTTGDLVITLCSGDVTAVHNGESYIPSTMKRSEVRQTQEMSKSLLQLTTSKNNPVADLFRTGAPEFPIFITVFRQHAVIDGSDFVVTYKGRVSNCSYTYLEAELNCEPIFTSLKRPGLRIKYEPTCCNGLYDVGCTLVKEDFAVNGTVLTTNSKRIFTIQAAATKPDGYFIGGILALGGLHMIADHKGTTITLVRHTIGAHVGDAVSLYPGCDHGRTTCHSRFNNIVNYKGFPWMSDRNPFTDNTINYIN